MNAPGDHGGREVMRTAHQVDHLLCSARVGHGCFENTHDRGGACTETFQANGPADDRGVFLKNRAPEAISEHCGTSGLGTVIAHVEQSAEHRVEAHHFEIITANHTSLHATRLAETNHGKRKGGEIAELFDTLDAGPQTL